MGLHEIMLFAAVTVKPDGPFLHGIDSGALCVKLGQFGFSFVTVTSAEAFSAFFVNAILNMVTVTAGLFSAVIVVSDDRHI
jgi:hypothetical protein